MAILHFTLQNKGGVGKTFYTILLSQYLRSLGLSVLNFDLDPLNTSFSEFKELAPVKVEIQAKEFFGLDPDKGDNIFNTVNTWINNYYDQCRSKGAENGEGENRTNEDFPEPHLILDVGASSFPYVNSYLGYIGYDVFREMGHKVLVHSVIGGGDTTEACMLGLNSVLDQCKGKQGVKVFIWLNEFLGKPVFLNSEKQPVPFEKTSIFLEHSDMIAGIISLENPPMPLSRSYLRKLMESHTLFSTVLDPFNPNYNVLDRTYVKKLQSQFFSEIESARFDEVLESL